MTKGFSIIELIIVLLISGIISGIVIPNYSKVQNYAKHHTLKQYGYTLQMALETYLLDHATYPNNTSIETLSSTLKTAALIKKLQNNPYTNAPHTNSDTNGKITYTQDPSIPSYTLKIYGNDPSTPLLILEN